jgi:hypothetical protein
MRYLIFLFLAACGSANDVEVKGGTTNKVVVEYRAPLCEDPVFVTVKDKLKCVRALTTLQIDGELRVEDLEGLSEEQVSVLGGVNE